MTVDEIRAAIQARGWTYRPKNRRGKPYIYAVRRNGTKLEERYLGASDRPDIMHQVEALPNMQARDVAQQEPSQAAQPSTSDEQQAPDPHQVERVQLQQELLEIGRLVSYEPFVLGAVNPDNAICIRPGLASWATYSAGLDITRLKHVLFYARRYYSHLQSVGRAHPAPKIESEETAQPLDLTTYSHDTMIYQGPHDQARRAWLLEWGTRRTQARPGQFWFTMWGKYSGYYQVGTGKTPEGWKDFLEKVPQFDVYCCFVAAKGEHPLEYYLEDAARRGEIKLDNLVWKPNGNRKT